MGRRNGAVFLVALALTGCASGGAFRTPVLMHAAQPEPGIVTAGQLQPSDIARLKAAGVREVIDLTRDSETPEFDEAAAVRAAGIQYENLPIHGAAGLTEANVRAFDALIRNSAHPIVVHCASSNRVGAMAALRAAWLQGQRADQAIETGKAWGLKGLEPEVRALLERGGPLKPSNPR